MFLSDHNINMSFFLKNSKNYIPITQSTPGRIRTCKYAIRSRAPYPLDNGSIVGRVRLELTMFTIWSRIYSPLASAICIPADNGTDRNRTCNTQIFSLPLYHLSYRPVLLRNLFYDQIIHSNIPYHR